MSGPASSTPLPSFLHVPGDRIAGKYELCRLIGEGGMGAVWLAENVLIESRVAVKLLRGDVQIQEAEARLRREACAGARVHHPAVVRVFDYGCTEHREPFIVMEVLEGQTLSEVIDRTGPLSAVEAVRTLLPIVDGLVSVHANGVVHRDLKPENIFLSKNGDRVQPKLVDFGIAKIETRNTPVPNPLEAPIMGSPSYMAPEQAQGRPDVDHRADLWGLCMVIYEAVTGSPPFSGDHYPTVLRRIVEEGVPPLRDTGGGEGELWAILRRGFVKDRNRRFSTAHELGEALADFLLARGVVEDVAGTSIAAAWKRAGAASRSVTPVAPPVVLRIAADEPTRTSLSREWQSLARRRRRARSFGISAVAAIAAMVAFAIAVRGTLAESALGSAGSPVTSIDAPRAPAPVSEPATPVEVANTPAPPDVSPSVERQPAPSATAATSLPPSNAEKRDKSTAKKVWDVSTSTLKSLGLKAAY